MHCLTRTNAPVEYYSLSFPDAGLVGCRIVKIIAIVAELADAHGSGPCTRKGVGVRVPSMAPRIICFVHTAALRLKQSAPIRARALGNGLFVNLQANLPY